MRASRNGSGSARQEPRLTRLALLRAEQDAQEEALLLVIREKRAAVEQSGENRRKMARRHADLDAEDGTRPEQAAV